MPREPVIIRRAGRFALELHRSSDGQYSVVHHGEVVYTSPNDAIADAHFELLRDELQAATGKDPMAQVRAEQSFRDVLGVRGEATRRRVTQENQKGGKGGRGGA